MSSRWMIEVKKHIGVDDKVQETCEGQLHGETGQLVLTRRRILFVKEEGLFRKKVLIPLELPYAKIKRVAADGSHKLLVYDINEIKHSFIVMETPAPKIESRLKEYMKRPHTPQIRA
ncbi:hypothetical protein ISS40_05050 [Candidatus Bathyarchaeota archaeon]|nr:hypothetical protein [Candidatus Bathyarchaeota archaeon]